MGISQNPVLRHDSNVLRRPLREKPVGVKCDHEIHLAVHRLLLHEHIRQIVAGFNTGKEGRLHRHRARFDTRAPRMGLHEGRRKPGGDNVYLRTGRIIGVDVQAPGPARDQQPYQRIAVAARTHSIAYQLNQFLIRAGRHDGQRFHRVLEPPEMRGQIVNVPPAAFDGFKHAVSPMDKVIINGNHHQNRIRDNSSQDA